MASDVGADPCDPNVPTPTVEGPITGGSTGNPHGTNFYDLGEYGFMEEEYFISGTAKEYPPSANTAPFKTRMLVWRPIAQADFNGTAVAEWENVTGQAPGQPVWGIGADSVATREGFAWVAVSAQAAGICCSPISLQGQNSERYGSLSHPGDTYSFDIFSQAAKAIGCPDPDGPAPLGNLQVERIIGAGQSQSASRLSRYANLVRDNRVVDALHIQSGGGKSYPPDLDVPIIQVLSEEGFSVADPNAPQSSYRLWEVAGSDHNSAYFIPHTLEQLILRSSGQPPISREEHEQFQDEAAEYGEDREKARAGCATGNSFPLRYAIRSSIHHLHEWIQDPNYSPPIALRAAFDALGEKARDEFGNALGGFRLPPIDIPVATYTGDACGLFGTTEPLCDAQLELLYPTHEDYVDQMQAASDAAVASGVLLPEDAADLMFRAERSVIGDLDERDCPDRPDFDEDGFSNAIDNCPVHANADQADGDGDGRGDACDNCAFIANPGQEDSGGIGTNKRDGIGNVCQCGDFNSNGVVNGQDGFFMIRFGLGIADPIALSLGNCDVTGNGVCNGQDGFFTTRAGLGYEDPLHVAPRGQNCPNADPSTPCTYCNP